MFAPVYLDHNATSPLNPVVLDAMLPWLRDRHGNASSRHEYGRAARDAIERARQQVAAAVGAHSTEVIFTSGGSEANNLFLKGLTACRRPGGLLVSAIDHPCVLRPAEQLARQGWNLRKLAVDGQGRVESDDCAEALQEKPALMSVMLANNETGVVQDIGALAVAAVNAGTCVHTDAVQALGRLPIDFRALNATGVRALTISAHKAGGPKGVGALIVDKRVELQPLIAGGGQERGLRSGTENVPAIVGFGVACELAVDALSRTRQQFSTLQALLERELNALGAVVFGQQAARLANTTYFAFRDIDGETLVGKLDRAGFAVASGAACSSANPEPSHVLAAMGVAPELARGAVRVSLGDGNNETQIKEFVGALQQTVANLKQLTAVAI